MLQGLHTKEVTSKRLQWKRTGQEDVGLAAVTLECSCLLVFPSCVREGNSREIMSNFCSLMEELSRECVVEAAALLQGDKAVLT